MSKKSTVTHGPVEGFAARRRRRRLSVLLLVGYLATYGAWQHFRFGPASDQTFISNASFWPVELFAIGACLRAAGRVRSLPRLVRAWRLFALAAAGQLLGDITYTIYQLLGVAPYPSLADAFYLLFYPLMLGGLVSLPRAPFAQARGKLMLDLATVTLGGAAVLVYLVLGPTAVADNGNALASAVTIAYPVGDVVAIAGLAAVLVRGSARSARWPLRVVSAALGLFVVADTVYSYQTLHGGYTDGSWLDPLWLIALALIAVAAVVQRPVRSREQSDSGQSMPSRISAGPYVAIAIGFGLLLYTDRNEDLFPGLTMTLIAFALAGLVSMRQLLGQRDLIGVQAKLSFRASHDGLTGLPNRTLLFDRLGQALARRDRADAQVAVLLLDVDDFKEINDTLGHAAGDELLVELANRLRGATRGHETVARLGGDEFALVAEGTFEDAGLITLAERLLDVFVEPFAIAGAPRRVHGSLGIVRSNGRATTADELLRDADTAMYRAKSSGGGGYDIFDGQLRAELVRHVGLRTALEQALRDGTLDVHYQPIVDTASGRTLAVEALCRWHDERFGQVGPNEFIPLAERSGLIVPLGRGVLNQAIGQLAAWRAADPTVLPHGIFVNVSAGELRRADYCPFVLDLLRRHGLEASDLAVELTERTLIDDNEPASVGTLGALAAAGVRLVLDDFGSGYSALASLKRFPLAALKLDQLFTAEIGSGQSEAPITRAVVALGTALGLLVIAEGVETPAQLAFLRSLGCPAVQGYLLGKPQAANDIEASFGAGRRQLPPLRSFTGRHRSPHRAQGAEVPSRP